MGDAAGSELTVSTPRQFRALGHPLRQRLLFALGQNEATVSQLAAALGEQKGNVAHHLRVLREAGMATPSHTRTVRGGTERYYRRTTERISIPGQHAGPAEAMLSAVAQEFAAAPGDPLLALRHVRLTDAQARRLAAVLQDVVAETAEAADTEPRYGILACLYQQSKPEPE